MTERYKIPDQLLNILIRNASTYPDPIEMDAMGQNPHEKILAWQKDLTESAKLIAGEAWMAGARWAMERAGKREYLVVTPEQYEELRKEADDGEHAPDQGDPS